MPNIEQAAKLLANAEFAKIKAAHTAKVAIFFLLLTLISFSVGYLVSVYKSNHESPSKAYPKLSELAVPELPVLEPSQIRPDLSTVKSASQLMLEDRRLSCTGLESLCFSSVTTDPGKDVAKVAANLASLKEGRYSVQVTIVGENNK